MTTHRCRRAAFSELPSTHQEALEAAITAGQSQGIRDERSTAERIEAAIAAYLTTLAPADNGLVDPTHPKRIWAGDFDHRNNGHCVPSNTVSTYSEYVRADTITAQVTEIERLKALLEVAGDFIDRVSGAAIGIAMSGDNHPNPDGVLMDFSREGMGLVTAIQEARHGN